MYKCVDELIYKIELFDPDVIVGIGRGGAIAGVLLSHRMNKPLALISIDKFHKWNNWGKKYGLSSNQKLAFYSNFHKNDKIFIVDDIYDSGDTMSFALEIVRKCIPENNISFGALVSKKLDCPYYGELLHSCPEWIVFPYENWRRRNNGKKKKSM